MPVTEVPETVLKLAEEIVAATFVESYPTREEYVDMLDRLEDMGYDIADQEEINESLPLSRMEKVHVFHAMIDKIFPIDMYLLKM